MRKALLVVWLLVPVAAAAYHFGPGQLQLTLDEAAACIATAEQHAGEAEATSDQAATREQWSLALESYEQALKLLPADHVQESRRLRLEAAKARMLVSQLPAAHIELEALIDELSSDPGSDATLLAETRAALASSQYYMTWLMRLEGAGREEWEPKIEGARQNYKWLAERALELEDDDGLSEQQRNLEAAIRLARMDLQELQGLPLPSQ